jgi:hypothetical protein
MVFELRRELPENPNPNEISDLSGDAGPHDASNPNNIDTQAGEETNPSALDGDITNEPTVEAQEHPQPPQADPTQGDGGTPNPGGVINTPTSSRRSFPDTDVSAVVMQQLEALGIVPELQGGEMDIETLRGAREEHLSIILDERDSNITKIMDKKLDELSRNQTTFLNAMEQRIIDQLRPQKPKHRVVQDSIDGTPSKQPNTEDWKNEFQSTQDDFDQDWMEAARTAAANNTSHRSFFQVSSPPPMGNRFGATSPPGNFRGRRVNLKAVNEEGSRASSRRSSPPLGSPPSRRGGHSFDDDNPPLGRGNSAFQAPNAFMRSPRKDTLPHIYESHYPTEDPKRGEMYSKYLGGADGFDSMEEMDYDLLDELGYVTPEVQKVVLRGASFVIMHDEKPDINPKYYTGFNRLEELNNEEFVDFYQHLSIKLRRYGIGLLEFDVVQPRWLHVGLCYPGVGETRYIQMAEELFNLLERLLPMTDSIVQQCYTTLVGCTHDGFKLLRAIMGKSIPSFCPYITSLSPLWSEYQDVARMSKLWKVHFRLNAKKGSTESPIEQSLMFIQSLDDPILAPHLTSIRGQIQSFAESIDEFDDSENALPTHLTIDGITATLTQFPTSLTTSINYARSNVTTLANRNVVDGFSDSDDDLDFQGSIASASVITSTHSQDNRSRDTRRTSSDNNRRSSSRRPSTTTEGADIVCRGCHRRGHEEINCRDLAKYGSLLPRQ